MNDSISPSGSMGSRGAGGGEIGLSPSVASRVVPPSSIGRLGLPTEMVEDVLLRALVAGGRRSLVQLSERLCCGVGVVESLAGLLRERRLVEYEGMSGRSYLISATDAGRRHARERSEECRYMGPLPVPLAVYVDIVGRQRPDVNLNQDRLRRAFSDLVVAPDLLDQLGPAICGDGAVFLHGPPGTGKSSIAERMIRAYDDAVLVPHAIEVDAQIVTVFDPILHRPTDSQPAGIDPRWVLCHRPAVAVGGELHAGMLDLHLERDAGTYTAPLQLRANNGVLVIDDFGRQSMTPAELLNRWIVPLDRHVDYLTLGGRKFEVPFELKVVFSTNLEPDDLGDEAFFRRIHNKIYVGGIDDEQFDWVLARAAKARNLAVSDAAATRLRSLARLHGDGELRAYLPGVACNLAVATCRYREQVPALTPEIVDQAMGLYFATTGRNDSGPEAPKPRPVGPLGSGRRLEHAEQYAGLPG